MPTLAVPLSRDRLSVISGITLDRRRFLHTQPHATTRNNPNNPPTTRRTW
ncbi:MAG TPA: hypothetical protein VFN02_08925 [Ktedonobacteraceae bacterium]|nr:hypothetical protein [Ktedonobacteraceae bacterium]